MTKFSLGELQTGKNPLIVESHGVKNLTLKCLKILENVIMKITVNDPNVRIYSLSNMAQLSNRLRQQLGAPVIWLFLTSSVIYAIPSWVRYATWRGNVWDMGFFIHALWLISHGHWLAHSPFEGGMPALGDAASFVLYPLAFWYRLTGAYGILWLQAVCLLSGVVFILRWRKRFKLNQAYDILLPVLYLIFPTVWGSLLFDFHPDVLAIPLLCSLIESIWDRRWNRYWILFVANLLVKDTMPITLFGVGLLLLIGGHKFRGAISMLGSVTWLMIASLWLIPLLSPTGHIAQWATTYGWISQKPENLLLNLTKHPTLLAVPWHRPMVWFYCVGIITSIGVIPLRFKASLIWLIPATTMVSFNIYSQVIHQQWLVNQYSLFIVPFLFASLITALCQLNSTGLRVALIAIPVPAFIMSGVTWVLFGHMLWPTRPAMQLTEASQLVSARAPVYGQDPTLYKLANRLHVKALTRFPPRAPLGSYALINTNQNPHHIGGMAQPSFLHMMAEFETSPKWLEVYHQGPIYLFHKTSTKT